MKFLSTGLIPCLLTFVSSKVIREDSNESGIYISSNEIHVENFPNVKKYMLGDGKWGKTKINRINEQPNFVRTARSEEALTCYNDFFEGSKNSSCLIPFKIGFGAKFYDEYEGSFENEVQNAIQLKFLLNQEKPTDIYKAITTRDYTTWAVSFIADKLVDYYEKYGIKYIPFIVSVDKLYGFKDALSKNNGFPEFYHENKLPELVSKIDKDLNNSILKTLSPDIEFYKPYFNKVSDCGIKNIINTTFQTLKLTKVFKRNEECNCDLDYEYDESKDEYFRGENPAFTCNPFEEESDDEFDAELLDEFYKELYVNN